MHRIGIIRALPVLHALYWFVHDGLKAVRLNGLIAANGGRAEIGVIGDVLVDAVCKGDFGWLFHGITLGKLLDMV